MFSSIVVAEIPRRAAQFDFTPTLTYGHRSDAGRKGASSDHESVPVGRRERKRAEIREKLYQAAITLFMTKGRQATNPDFIQEETPTTWPRRQDQNLGSDVIGNRRPTMTTRRHGRL